MILRNRSQYDTAEVRRLVKFAVSQIDMRGVCINVKNARSVAARGRCYSSVPFISDAPSSAEYLVTIGIGAPDAFPFDWAWDGKLGPHYTTRDWREALVVVAAHEALHVEQFKEGLPRSEVKCERFAEGMLRRYRDEVTA